MLRTLALTVATASAAIHCSNLGDYQCYSFAGFCLNHLVRPCENGTICDEDYRKHHPTESPCIDPAYSYYCNTKNYTCSKGTGLQTFAACKKGCHAPEYKCDHTEHKCVEVSSGGESKAACEKSCVPPPKYVCDHTTYKCVPHAAGSSEADCEKTCKHPTPPPAPTHSCSTIANWNCENTKGFCLNHAYYPCETGTLCSETFHKHHPTESPCINPDQSYGCNKETKQCVERSGYQNATECQAACK